ncbi:MAG: SDR family oxidoreductase [Patescibacteria group bacterium]|nr:SDR family oxidoreductase [Patescibacteria group bacterium]
MNVSGKIAIVTGVSSGIGLATATLLTQKGAKVVLVARSKEKLRKLSKELPRSLAVPADMTIEKDIKAMVKTALKHFGRIDILINNAGRGYDAPVAVTNPDLFRSIFELDVVGPLIAMQSVIPIMRREGGGMIVNISSGTALMYLPNMGPYSSLKRALANISLTARQELKKDRIKVSVVYPYITLTDFEKNTLKNKSIITVTQEENDNLPPSDTKEFVAEKILEVIKTEQAEQYAHDWMKK